MSSRSSRYRLTSLGGAVLLAVLSACSGGSPKTVTNPLSVSLTSADLPAGFTAAGVKQPPDAAQRQVLYTCLGAPPPTVTAATASSLFRAAQVSVYSTTEVLGSSSAATADLETQRSAKWTACASTLVPQLFAVLAPGSAFGDLSVATVAFPTLGGGTVAHRLTLPVTRAGAKSVAVGDVVTAVDGNVEVTVWFVGATAPPSDLSEQAIVKQILAGH